MNKVLLLFFLAIFNASAFAGRVTPPVIDIYKTDQVSVEDLKKKFSKQFQKIKNIQLSQTGVMDQRSVEKYGKLLKSITNGINKMGDFAYVGVSPVLYSAKENIYITVDIVDQKDKKRLALFTPEPTESLPDPDNLISSWEEYEKNSMDLFMKNKIPPVVKYCPAFHCLFGFEYPGLQKYQVIFEKNVSKDKAKLVAILRQDKDPQKRAAAAFLLAHIKNGDELIGILVPSIYDPSEGVRNNVMRVLGMTISKMKNPNFPIEKLLPALTFPAETDRNKALFVVSSLVVQPRYAQYVRQHASEEIMDNLKMSQLNLHDTAYAVLTTMSGKKFDSRDYVAWSNWLNSK